MTFLTSPNSKSTIPRMDSLEDAQEQAQEWQEAPLVEVADQGDEEEDLEQEDLDRAIHQNVPSPNNTSRSPP